MYQLSDCMYDYLFLAIRKDCPSFYSASGVTALANNALT